MKNANILQSYSIVIKNAKSDHSSYHDTITNKVHTDVN